MDWLRVILVGVLSLALSCISILCCYVFGTHLAPGDEGAALRCPWAASPMP